MRGLHSYSAILGLLLPAVVLLFWLKVASADSAPSRTLNLPEPRLNSGCSVEEALLKRRSVRDYTDASLTLAEVSQLLWAAQGLTDRKGFRTAPSAGALYPLETYLLVGKVEGLAAGVYRYQPNHHGLVEIATGDRRAQLAAAALNQSCLGEAPVSIIFTAIYERTTAKYGERGSRYVHMEAGHASQNVYLQAAAINLSTVAIGAFHQQKVQRVLDLPENEQPLYIMPIGKRRS
jgi:SagB-type dehydrogenase family enzyme